MVQVENSGSYTIRFRFKKMGSLQYVSHLDLVRTMHKIVVRSSLPLKYTEGFNPKPKMVFAAPLSIGTESLCEFLDLRLSERVDESVALEALNRNMTDEMQAVEAYYPDTKFTDLRWLSYTVSMKTAGASDELCERINAALSSDVIEIEKKTKSGIKPVNIRPLIKSADAFFDGEEIRIVCLLSADPSEFLNPEYMVKYLRESVGVLSDPCLTNEYYSILREEAYTADMQKFR